MEDVKVKIIEKGLDKINNIYIAILIFTLTIFSFAQSNSPIEISKVRIPIEYGGLILLAIVFGLSFQLSRIYRLIFTLYKSLSTERGKAKFIMNHHTGIFNPFAETEDEDSPLYNNLGFGLQGFVFLMAELVILKSSPFDVNGIWNIVFIILVGLLLIFNFFRINSVKYHMNEICAKSEKSKRIMSTVIGIIGLIILIGMSSIILKG